MSAPGRLEHFTSWLVSTTEAVLTRRRRRLLARKEKRRRKGAVRDWIEAILSAVVIVLVINQYLLQAYQIPSPSMTPTLLVTDRIFVNKLVYGPELVPAALKIDWLWKPQRGDIVIFESPQYLSKGAAFDVLQRIIYMLTLSLVDIDRGASGQSNVHVLVKRAIGLGGDRIRMNQGNVEVLTPGESTWISEAQLKSALGLTYTSVRIYTPDQYASFRDIGVFLGLSAEGLKPDAALTERLSTVNPGAPYDDRYALLWADATKWAVSPDDFGAADGWRLLREGYAVPAGRIFPMGDNRDNSADARYFGPVALDKVLGKGLFRYWPLYRIGGL